MKEGETRYNLDTRKMQIFLGGNMVNFDDISWEGKTRTNLDTGKLQVFMNGMFIDIY